ncbi:MFS transporter [Enterococcus hailinensis]|uniref:MFS transporter n=1 Tax=Enterococcus hailinensis TaxID=3238988 RepID=UPI0038B33130
MGMIASFYFAGSTFMQIPAGVLVDRFGKKIILIPGFLLFGIAALVISQTPSLQIIYAASVFAGLGCGCYYGAAYSITSENIPEEKRSVATAFINNGAAVGMGMGMILSSLLVKKNRFTVAIYDVPMFILNCWDGVSLYFWIEVIQAKVDQNTGFK